jgi:hypothetical protein
MGCSPICRRSLRAMYMVLVSADPKLKPLGVLPSAMKNCQRPLTRRAHEGAVQSFHAMFAPSGMPRLQLLHRRAHLDAVDVGGIGLPKLTVTRIRNPPRHLPQKASALKAEDASPYSIQVHGNDGHIDALHDAFQAAAEGKQLAGARDLPFGEDANDLVVAQRVAGGLSECSMSRGCCSLRLESPSPSWRMASPPGGRRCPGT